MNFAQRLKQVREESGFSQAELAKEIDRSRTSVSGYETFDRLPDVETLLKLAKHFDVSLDWLMGLSDIRKPINLEENPEMIYKEIFDAIREKLILEGFITAVDPIPPPVLKLSLEFGLNATFEILKVKK